MSIIIGVDPGKSGAIAGLNYDGTLRGVDDMPVVGPIISPVLLDEAVHNYIDPLSLRRGAAVIEDVHAMPKQGVSSVFSFGRSLGVAEGVLAGNGLAVHYVSPVRWKRALGLTSDKGVSRRRAIELWPERAQWFARVKDDGRAEAALIAYWFLHHGDGRAVAA
jgi:crossover junction endodeoxyribonuclease RuvC